jgi:hypothetical protein
LQEFFDDEQCTAKM